MDLSAYMVTLLEDNLLEDVSQPANSFFWPAQPVNAQLDCRYFNNPHFLYPDF
jgi:hypothetical protein